jgi:hypothetical protein
VDENGDMVTRLETNYPILPAIADGCREFEPKA